MSQELNQKQTEALAKSTSDSWGLTEWEIVPGNNYIIGRHRVMFGYRLRVLPIDAGVTDSPVVDWCIAANPNGEVVYRRFILNLVEKATDKVIQELPFTSNTRPVYNDKEFHTTINAIAEKHDGIPISETLREAVQQMQVHINPLQN